MPADYKSHMNRKEKKPMPGYMWLLAGLGIGLFVAFIIYLDKQPASEISFGTAVKTELDKLKQQKQDKAKQAASQTAAKKTEPKFNFYTILPELEVLIPDEEIRPPENRDETRESGKAKQFILQAGSFRNRQDAERLKASIALLGLEASINQVVIENERWHRVRIGPVNNRAELNRQLAMLQRNKINAMAMELK